MAPAIDSSRSRRRVTRRAAYHSWGGTVHRPRLSGLRKRAGETRQDHFASRDTVPMPERNATCGDCGASMTFPAGGWEEVQRSAIDACAKAHELAAHEGKSVSGWSLDPNPARHRD